MLKLGLNESWQISCSQLKLRKAMVMLFEIFLGNGSRLKQSNKGEKNLVVPLFLFLEWRA